MKAATQMVVVEKKYGSTKQEVREVNFFPLYDVALKHARQMSSGHEGRRHGDAR